MKIQVKKAGIIIAATIAMTSVQSIAADKPLYRGAIYGDHFYTTNMTEMLNATTLGYNYEGVTITLVNQEDADADKALFRLYNSAAGPGGDHFYTTDYAERIDALTLGYLAEGIEGYTTKSKEKALYRSYQSEVKDHLYTADLQEVIDISALYGYEFERIEGYGK